MSRLSWYKHAASTNVFDVAKKIKEARKNPRNNKKRKR